MADVPGDFDLLVDDDGTAYHVQTTTNDPNATRGFTLTALDASFTAPASPRRSATFVAPKPAEGPVLFRRGAGEYYLLGGTTCCACKGGSSIYVFRAPAPLGPWRSVPVLSLHLSLRKDPQISTSFPQESRHSSQAKIKDRRVRATGLWRTSAQPQGGRTTRTLRTTTSRRHRSETLRPFRLRNAR